MPPKKETITREEFNALKRDIEHHSQILVNQLRQKITDNEEKCLQKIADNEEKCLQKIADNEEKCMNKIIDNERKYQKKIEELEAELNEIKFNNNNKQKYTNNPRSEPGHISEMTRPSFYGNNRDMHPVDFLHRLDEYFAIKQLYTGEKIIVVGDCLKATALNWFSTIRFQLRDYDDFRKAFIDEYWSREIQIQVWSQCLGITHIPQNTNFREHFATWATKLRHLEVPHLSEPEIVKHIAKHYPGYLRAILVSMPERTILSAMKVLGEEGQSQPRKDDNRHQQQNNNQHENNRPNNGQEGTTTNNNWNQRPHNRTNNYQQNNRWNNRQNNQSTPRENQQINQVTTNTENDEPEQTINRMEGNGESFSPYIQCLIEGEEVEILVDTGATISVLTKEIVDTIIKKNPRLPQLPVTGVKISNAVGKQICKTSKQIFCQCQLGEASIVANFIQVEGLNERGIIGSDILNKYNMQIDYDDHTIRMKISGKIYFIPFSKRIPKITAPQDSIKNITITDYNEKRKSDQVTISDQENEQFDTLMKKYTHIFSDRPGRITAFECQIRTTKGTPIYQKPYPIPVSKSNSIDKEIQRMLELGIIETSTSPWSSPMVGIEKKNGELRICIDARKINTRIIPDRERPMNIDEIMNKFQGVKYLSSIDLTAGYWQCPLQQDCREITAFLHKGRNYQYQVLPFGLVNSVAEFQKILDRVLGPEILQFVAIYVDDIHIMSKSFKEHLYHLETIFNKFAEHNVTINYKKSSFLRKSVIFLGHVISAEGMTMDPEKIKTIQNFQPPKNKKQVQSFLGFINFYRKYIRDLSLHTEILNELTRKKSTWDWGERQQRAFEEIKQKFLEDIIIQYPDFNNKFFISTDASRTHLGAELFQINQEGQHQTLSFISRTLNTAERNYGTTELELLAIVFACKKFRNYILGYETHLLTDHQALVFLNSCQLLNSRLTRWAIKLQEYHLHIQHIPGKDNVGADTLTRYPQSPEDDFKTIQITINKLMLNEYSPSLIQQFDQIEQLQGADPKLRRILSQLNNKKYANQFFMFNKLLFIKTPQGRHLLMIPQVMNGAIIIETHERYGHLGPSKIYQMLHRQYQLHNMYRTVKRTIKTCDLCQKSKCTNQRARGPTQSILPNEPLQIVSLDLMGPLPRGQGGSKYILAILDIFSKYIQLYPLKKATTETILKRITQEYIPNVGKMQSILTDNGTQFRSNKWYNALQLMNIRTLHTTPYHPESNPVERANREIGRMLRTYCHKKHTAWVKWLTNIEYWINHATHESTNFTPIQILRGTEPNININKKIHFPENAIIPDHKGIIEIVRTKLKSKSEKRNQQKDKNMKFVKYMVGQQVLVKEHKLSSAEDREIHKFFLLYKGPFTIKSVNENNTITVYNDQNILYTHNVKNVKKYMPPDPGKGNTEDIPSRL